MSQKKKARAKKAESEELRTQRWILALMKDVSTRVGNAKLAAEMGFDHARVQFCQSAVANIRTIDEWNRGRPPEQMAPLGEWLFIQANLIDLLLGKITPEQHQEKLLKLAKARQERLNEKIVIAKPSDVPRGGLVMP